MFRRLLPLLTAACAAACSAAAPAGGGEEKTPEEKKPASPLYLIVDYLPAFMYKGERLAYSFRVERPPERKAEVPFTVSWHFEDEGGRKLAPGARALRTAEHFTIVRGFLRVPPGARRFRYELGSGGRRLGGGAARILREEEPWVPGSLAGWDGLYTAEGEKLILTLRERAARVDDRCKPIKWLWDKSRGGAESVLLVGPRLAARGAESYQDLLAAGSPKAQIVALPELPEKAGREGLPPRGIYRLVELVESKVAPKARGSDLLVLVAPPDDPEMATEPRRYRQGLDWVLSRLRRAKAERVALLPPLSKRVSGKQLAAYAGHCRKAAEVYKARFLAAEAVLRRECWTLNGAGANVTGRYPNAEGHKALAELVRKAYR